MVIKHAAPPIRLDTGSARNTPRTPKNNGKINIKGITIIPLRNIEKNIDCFARPSAVNVDCPEN